LIVASVAKLDNHYEDFMIIAMFFSLLVNGPAIHSVDLAKRTENEWICTRCRKPAEGHYCARCGQPYIRPKSEQADAKQK